MLVRVGRIGRRPRAAGLRGQRAAEPVGEVVELVADLADADVHFHLGVEVDAVRADAEIDLPRGADEDAEVVTADAVERTVARRRSGRGGARDRVRAGQIERARRDEAVGAGQAEAVARLTEPVAGQAEALAAGQIEIVVRGVAGRARKLQSAGLGRVRAGDAAETGHTVGGGRVARQARQAEAVAGIGAGQAGQPGVGAVVVAVQRRQREVRAARGAGQVETGITVRDRQIRRMLRVQRRGFDDRVRKRDDRRGGTGVRVAVVRPAGVHAVQAGTGRGGHAAAVRRDQCAAGDVGARAGNARDAGGYSIGGVTRALGSLGGIVIEGQVTRHESSISGSNSHPHASGRTE
ncbi:hypothetical protein CEQ30_40895 [Nocardia brasiliensis]|nr:hypothetical protein CEQ30_40895 [Nocardia brasiliensis]